MRSLPPRIRHSRAPCAWRLQPTQGRHRRIGQTAASPSLPAAASALHLAARHGLAQKHRRLEIDGIDLVERFLGHLVERLLALNADAIDEHIETAVPLVGGVDRRADAGRRFAVDCHAAGDKTCVAERGGKGRCPNRRAFPAASYLAYLLGKLDMRYRLLTNMGDMGGFELSGASERDALIAISFTPYSPPTVEIARAAAEQAVPVVSITDSTFSPLAHIARVCLEVVEEDYVGFRSLGATFCLCMALATYAAKLRAD